MTRTAKQTLLILVSLLAYGCMPAMAQSKTYCERELGYYFYCEEAAPEPNEEDLEQPIPVVQYPGTAAMEAVRATLEDAKDMMIYDPTPENVERYMRLQKKWVDNAAFVTSQWKRVIWSNPDLDPTIRFPVNSIGRQSFEVNKKQSTAELINELSGRYALIYFGEGDCYQCAAFEDILKGFADRWQFSILPVSLNGQALAGFEQSVPDTGQMANMDMEKIVPAVALYDRETNSTIPIGYGLLSMSEMERRIRVLTNNGPGEEYGVMTDEIN